MADDVKVSVGVDNSPLVAGLAEAKSAISNASSAMSNAFEGVAGSISKITGLLGAMTAVLAGGSALKGAVSAAVEWDSTNAKLAKSLGISTEAASVYQTALKSIGVNSDVLTEASLKLSKQIATNEAAFGKLGITTRDASGNLRPMNDILTDSLERLRNIQNPIDRNAAGMALFGKAWGEVAPLMKLTSSAMDEAAKRAKELGLVTSGDSAASAKAYQVSMRELSLTVQAFSIAIGRELLPVLTQTAAAMSGELPKAGEIVSNVFKGAVIVFETLSNSLQKVGLFLGAFAAAVGALASGDFAGVKAIKESFSEDIDALNRKLADFYEKMSHPPPPPKMDNTPDSGDSGELDALKKDKKTRQETIEQLADFAMELDTRVTAEHARLMQQQLNKDQAVANQQERQLQELSDFAQQLDTRVTQEHARVVAQKNKLDQKAADDFQRTWGLALRTFENSFSTAFSNLVSGSATFGSAMRGMFASIADAAVQTAAKNVAALLEGMVLSNSIRSQEIKKDAGAAAAAAYKAVVGIPYIGPFLAPPAAAVAYAGVLAFDSAAGGYDIPAGSNPMTQLHEREMVLPQSLADPIRDMASGGRRSGSTVHIHGKAGSTFTQDQLVAMLRSLGHQFKLA